MSHPFPPTALRRRHAQTVRDSSSSHRIDYVIVIKTFLNPKDHPNPINGSKVTAILLKGWILPVGGASAVKGLRLTGGLPRLVSLNEETISSSLYGSKMKCPRTETVYFPLSEISEEAFSLLLLAFLFHLSSRPHGLWAVPLLHFCYSPLVSTSMRIPFSRPWMSAMISFPARGSVQ